VQCAEFPTEHLYCSKQRSTPVSYTKQQRYISEIVRKVRKKIGVSFIHIRYSPGSEVVVFAMVTNTLVRKLLPYLEACHISQAR
jgi:2,4-dienoyl-CoA reductase-like NADH-dependent reductase (Old Yellow Enzyme family)